MSSIPGVPPPRPPLNLNKPLPPPPTLSALATVDPNRLPSQGSPRRVKGPHDYKTVSDEENEPRQPPQPRVARLVRTTVRVSRGRTDGAGPAAALTVQNPDGPPNPEAQQAQGQVFRPPPASSRPPPPVQQHPPQSRPRRATLRLERSAPQIPPRPHTSHTNYSNLPYHPPTVTDPRAVVARPVQPTQAQPSHLARDHHQPVHPAPDPMSVVRQRSHHSRPSGTQPLDRYHYPLIANPIPPVQPIQQSYYPAQGPYYPFPPRPAPTYYPPHPADAVNYDHSSGPTSANGHATLGGGQGLSAQREDFDRRMRRYSQPAPMPPDAAEAAREASEMRKDVQRAAIRRAIRPANEDDAAIVLDEEQKRHAGSRAEENSTARVSEAAAAVRQERHHHRRHRQSGRQSSAQQSAQPEPTSAVVLTVAKQEHPTRRQSTQRHRNRQERDEEVAAKAEESEQKLMQEVEEEITCPVCMCIMPGPQMIRPCLHTICGLCASAMLEERRQAGRHPTCPQCRASFDLDLPLVPCEELEQKKEWWLERKLTSAEGWDDAEEHFKLEEKWQKWALDHPGGFDPIDRFSLPSQRHHLPISLDAAAFDLPEPLPRGLFPQHLMQTLEEGLGLRERRRDRRVDDWRRDERIPRQVWDDESWILGGNGRRGITLRRSHTPLPFGGHLTITTAHRPGPNEEAIAIMREAEMMMDEAMEHFERHTRL